MTSLTNAQRSSIRRAALAEGIKTSSWNEDQMRAYGLEHGLLAPEGVPEPATAPTPVDPAPTAAEIQEAIQEASEPSSEPSAGPSVDAAIRALIQAASGPATLDEERVIALIQEHAASAAQEPIQVEYKARNGDVKVSGHSHYILPKLIKWLDLDEHIWLWGPASSGKTHIARQCAELLDLQFYSIGAILQKYEMTGYTDANGIFQSTEFCDWFKNGGLLYWDEADASIPQAFIAANGGLENKFMAFPSLGTIEMHESCKLICTANTNGEGATQAYNGRTKLDRATIDRFHQISMDYDTALERKVGLATYAQYGGEDAASAERLIDWFHSLRKACKSKRLDILVSSRMQRRALKSLAVDPSEAAQDAQDIAFAKVTEDQKNDLIAVCGAPLAA